MNPVERIHQGLVVSCQAWPDSPLHGPVHMAAMAQAAEKGGAAGIRANGVADIAAIAGALQGRPRLPIIGIQKSHDTTGQLWITSTFEEAAAVARAGADIVAVDSRREERPDGTLLGALFSRVRAELGMVLMADVATFDQALRAQDLGADLVAPTFAILDRETPDFDLLQRLTKNLSVPVVAEGLYWTPTQVCTAFELGAHAVVVGTAITRPDDITLRFVDAIRAHFSAT
jgi:putative N-acetylmannosamine-6-phosphate epimerase